MFKNAKVGDRVWSFHYGWGIIFEIDKEHNYPIRVNFKNSSQGFMIDGRYYEKDDHPDLFWDVIKFEIPKRKVKKWIAICVFDKIRLVMVKNSSLGKTDTLLDVNSDALALFDTKEEALKCVPCVKYTFEVEIEE